MKNRQCLLMFLCTLLFCVAETYESTAQSFPNIIQGKVVDKSSGDPLIGAYITISGVEENGAVTDLDGNYSLDIPASLAKNAGVNISYIGYVSRYLTLKELIANPQIFLEIDSELIEEVVVVGYGVQKKASNVGSITQTKGEDLLSSGNINTVSEALQGRLNGVVAVNSSGQPGDNAASLLIRGKSTWQNTDPLVLVDGIERNMNDVDFNEIESISVLKDASATAVYGVRGGNGVILLTTKRGTLDKPTVNFSANIALKNPTAVLQWPDYVTSMKLFNEAAANDQSWDSLFPQSSIDAWSNAYATGNYGPYNELFPEVDWYDELVKPAVSQNYNVNVNGKSAFMKYFASVGFQRDGGIYDIPENDDYDPRAWFKKLNWRANFDFNLTKTTILSVNIAGKMGTRNTQQYANIYKLIVEAPVNSFPIKYDDGYWGDSSVRGSNVIADLYHGDQYTYNSFQGWYDAKIQQDLGFITQGLKCHATISFDSASTTQDTLRDGGLYGGNDNASKNLFPMEYRKYDYSNPIQAEDGSISYPVLESYFHNLIFYETPNDATYNDLKSSSSRLFYELGVDWSRDFNEHSVTAMLLMNRQKIDESNNGTVFQFPQYTEDWVGRVTYNWNQRYLAELNVSYTGSEKFAKGKRFGLFPSFSAGWRVTEEPWMRWSSKVLSNLKIRYSWGKVGNDRGASRFQYIQLYNQTNGTNFGKDNNVLWGPGYTEGTIAQPNATWETSVKRNLGVEMGLWKKLRMELDLYDENRSGILLSPRTTAPWVGATIASANIGKTKSHGIDLQTTWNDKIGTDLHYTLSFMFSTSENRIVYKDDPSGFLNYEKDAGKPIGYQLRYLASGNFETIDDIFNAAQTSLTTADKLIPGDFAYIDYNADGVIDSKDRVVMPYLNYPLTTYSLTLSLDWKGFGLVAMLYAPTGVRKDSPEDYIYDFPSGYETPKAQPQALDRWTNASANTTGVMRPAMHIASQHNEASNSWVYSDYSYLRLKNLEISYKLPKTAIKSMNMSHCTFFLSGNNLFTWWKGDDRIDPEVGGQNVYPIVKTYTTGLRCAF